MKIIEFGAHSLSTLHDLLPVRWLRTTQDTSKDCADIGQPHTDSAYYQQSDILGLGSSIWYAVIIIGWDTGSALIVRTAVITGRSVAVFGVIIWVGQVGIVFSNNGLAFLRGVVRSRHARQTGNTHDYQAQPHCEKLVFSHVYPFEVGSIGWV